MRSRKTSIIRKTLVVVLSLGFSLPAFGPLAYGRQNRNQQNPRPIAYPPKLIEELNRLREAALSSDYAYRATAYMCNNIGPRLSGTPQAERAVEYVASEMRKLGLDVKLEKVMVPRWVRGVETGEIIEFPGQAAGTTQKVVLTALGGSVATPPAGITAEVVVARSFEHLQSLGREKVAGKIVVFNYAFDQQLAGQGEAGEAYGRAVAYRYAGASAAARLGAVAALNRAAGGARYRLPHTGSMGYAEDAPQIPGGLTYGRGCRSLSLSYGPGKSAHEADAHAPDAPRR